MGCGKEDYEKNIDFIIFNFYLLKLFLRRFGKEKVGLRIISYDRPKDWPTHYHAQFWAYDEATQKYEMLEEIWEAEEDTPPDGLIFAGAKEGLN